MQRISTRKLRTISKPTTKAVAHYGACCAYIDSSENAGETAVFLERVRNTSK